MKAGAEYKIILVDGEVVEGVYKGPERGFYVIQTAVSKRPIRASSIRRVGRE